jgi:tRNA pseudouridine55 synthase
VSDVDGIVVVDKPAGRTSHDVVARVRRLAGTRRVGHAGTLDPGATGVLVVGVGRATRLLGHLALDEKAYDATVRLGLATVTDDAEGEPTGGASTAGLADDDVRAALGAFRGPIRQVPSAVSAVKVGGVRAYARVRGGEEVRLEPRAVVVHELEATAFRRPSVDLLDVDVRVVCSSGTYVRALARDLGAALGVGGSLTALRRTRSGPFEIGSASTLDQLAASFTVTPLAAAVAAAFPRLDLDAAAAADLAHGRPLPVAIRPPGVAEGSPVGAFAPDGSVVGLVQERDGWWRPLVVLAPASGPGP